ncbi:MAG: hypothetical protein JSU94_16105 [Phycisphaerales bacterium]|nr:MAG: hypothetical protein JSU94_16105 [Phycisphaerales bacterium]
MKSEAGKPAVRFLVMVLAAATAFGQETQIRYLSGKGKDDPVRWEFFCTGGMNSGKWTTIGVPSNWELQGFGSYNYGHDKNKASEQGKYRHSLTVPDNWREKRVFIVFEGSMTDTEVWINGRSAGPKHQGGFYRFKYDITDKVRFGGENVLEATVSKVSSDASVEAAERAADYWVFGGIYRPVYLEAVPREFIEWAGIDARADGSICVEVHVSGTGGAGLVTGRIVGPDNALKGLVRSRIVPGAGKVTLTGKIPNVKPWTAETPNLYDIELSLEGGGRVIHKVGQRFGFRTFEVRPGWGLFLNGRKIRLKGVNRHCFWPDSGRCLSRRVSYDDVRLIKQMNMNAVRMSHYPPDVHFLEACDELGLYVLDELAGWGRPPYETEVGRKLVKEMVARDVSHPCILFWDNGNEWGWNSELDDEFGIYDPQKRVVLHPLARFGAIDTAHYLDYERSRERLAGSTIFLPTEFLHGLFDGGLGAGLDDYWELMLNSPVGAGGFLWVLADEGVVRTDKNGQIDVYGTRAPDGIVGPYREKEGSYYTIREIWSPVFIAMATLAADFEGEVEVENRYDFTNLNECNFEWALEEFPKPLEESHGHRVLHEDSLRGPPVDPGGKGVLKLDLPGNWRKADVLYVTAFDPFEQEIWTWSWRIQKVSDFVDRYVGQESLKNGSDIDVIDHEKGLQVRAGGLDLWFDESTGYLQKVSREGVELPLGGGPRLLVGDMGRLTRLRYHREQDSLVVKSEYESGLNYARWQIYRSGWIKLDYQYEMEGTFHIMGVGFEYPENQMRNMTWVGRGPYRVWKNRTKGGRLGLWRNRYKDHTAGRTWDFPEFCGYYNDWHWVVFETKQGRIAAVNRTEDLFLGVYRPGEDLDPSKSISGLSGIGMSFLHGIPAVGTKFKKAERLGPAGKQNSASGKYNGRICLYFESDG